MIKVEVTHLKAPWPAGAVVGAVVALATAKVPGWAAGKCTVLGADDEREPVAVWEPRQIDHSDPQERTFVVNPAVVADQAARIAELQQQLADAEQALGTARAEIASLVAERDAARADLQALQQAVPPTAGTTTTDAPAAAPAAATAAKTAKRSTAA